MRNEELDMLVCITFPLMLDIPNPSISFSQLKPSQSNSFTTVVTSPAMQIVGSARPFLLPHKIGWNGALVD